MRAMRVKSTSKIELTCADVCFDTTMCSAISARIFDIGSTTSPGHGSGSGPCGMAPRGAAATGAARRRLRARLEECSTRSLLRDATGDAAALKRR